MRSQPLLRLLVIGLSASALLFAFAPGNALAQVRPGDIVTAQQARRIKRLVAPGVYYKVANGMSMKIVPTSRVEWPPPYREATEKYSEQVRLSPDGRTVLNYVAGQPFPFLDPNDPQVATKIIWNNVFRPITSDDYDLRYFACENMYTGLNRPYRVIDEIDVGHYAGYNEIGRTEVEPMPIDPDFKRTGRYWLFALYPIMSPENMRGAGFVRYRYANPRKGDDIWSWNTGTRRLRRLDEPEMSDAVTGAGCRTKAAAISSFSIRITIRDSMRKSRSTTIDFSARRICSAWFMPPIRRKLPARPTAAGARARRTGRCVTCTSSKRRLEKDTTSCNRRRFSTSTVRSGIRFTKTNTTRRVSSGRITFTG